MERMPDRASRCWSAAAAALVLLSTAVAVGCGPVRSTRQINEAKVDFERARVAEAYRTAPYEYFTAQYYLHKAEEEWGYSDFESAYDFAERAERAAGTARRKAREDPWSDLVEGRSKTYEVSPRESLTADPSRIRGLEETHDRERDDSEESQRDPPPDDSGR